MCRARISASSGATGTRRVAVCARCLSPRSSNASPLSPHPRPAPTVAPVSCSQPHPSGWLGGSWSALQRCRASSGRNAAKYMQAKNASRSGYRSRILDKSWRACVGLTTGRRSIAERSTRDLRGPEAGDGPGHVVVLPARSRWRASSFGSIPGPWSRGSIGCPRALLTMTPCACTTCRPAPTPRSVGDEAARRPPAVDAPATEWLSHCAVRAPARGRWVPVTAARTGSGAVICSWARRE